MVRRMARRRPSFHKVRRTQNANHSFCEASVRQPTRCGSPPRPRSPSLPPARRPGPSTPSSPRFGNDGYDVRHYAVTLDVDGGTHRLSGRAVLTVKAEAELAKFALDLSGLEVTAVRVNGVPATYDRAPGKLRVKPVKPFGKGSVFSVDVAYRGAPGTSTTRPSTRRRHIRNLAGPTGTRRPTSSASRSAPAPGIRSTTSRPTRPPTRSR